MDQQNKIAQTLMDELGISNFPEDKQEELIIKMTEVILKRMFVEIMDKLNPEEQDAYGKMLDNGAMPEEVENFVKDKIPDYDKIMDKVIADFKQDLSRNSEATN